MAKFKQYDYSQGKMIPIYFEDQILPGTFEYALNHIVCNELDLSIFEPRYKNDETGAPAFDPAILLKIVLYAYSRGITSSRRIEWCCQNNIIFKALSADTQPHFTTIANFISSLEKEIALLFRNVLLICDELNLIGKEMFAIDGCKLSSNASKEWSGTREDFKKKKEKIEKSIQYILKKHRTQDESEGTTASMIKEEEKHLKSLRAKAKKIKEWLQENKDKKGKTSNNIKSNITDNESAKMATSHGVIQGYDGVAAADSKHQVIVEAQAFGAAQEHDLLKPMIEGTQENFKEIGKEENIFKATMLTADSGFHTEENMKMLCSEEIDGYVADNRFRKRDPRFATANRHKQEIKKKKQYKPKYYTPKDFNYNESAGKCICPAGNELWLKSKNFVSSDGFTGVAFMGRVKDCRSCKQRTKCLRNPKTEARQVAFLNGVTKEKQESYTQQMIKKMDTEKGRFIYSKRMGTIEPVFGNICSMLGLNRFSLRGKIKVNIQWKLYSMTHNLFKIYRYGAQMS